MMPFLTPSRPLSSPSSHHGPFLWHTLTGPSWVVQPAEDTNQTWYAHQTYCISPIDAHSSHTARQQLKIHTYIHTRCSKKNRMLCNTYTSIISAALCFSRHIQSGENIWNRKKGWGCREKMEMYLKANISLLNHSFMSLILSEESSDSFNHVFLLTVSRWDKRFCNVL